MKVALVIAVDLEHAPPGGRSRLADALCGEPVLRRTFKRALLAKRPSAILVLTPAAQRAATADLLSGLPVEIATHDFSAPPYAALVRAGRAWGLDGWRGGIGGLCVFDEDANMAALSAWAERSDVDAVAVVPAHAALVAPDLIDGAIAHYQRVANVFGMVFTPAPPGLAPVVFSREFVMDMAPTAQPPGSVLAYRPSHPAVDMTGRDACFRPAAVVLETPGRLLADTARSFRSVERLVAAGATEWDAERIARRLRDGEFEVPLDAPEEIEIELTTSDAQTDGSILRPRGGPVPPRGPMTAATMGRIAESLRSMEDVRIVLGGFGEPLEHSQAIEALRLFRDSGAAAVALRTNGLAGDEAVDAALFELPVDVLHVTIDAATPQTYRAVHGNDGFEHVMARVERWMSWRVQRGQVRPLIVPELCKSTLTLADMESFFDHWFARLGWCSITGYSHCAAQRADLAVMPMAPPRRIPCRRLWTRMMVLADGSVVACDQDFAARAVLGNVNESPLRDIWTGGALASLRSAHFGAAYDAHPLCPHCDEWHRP